MRKVLDAWALLAYLNEELPAADWVDTLLEQADRGEIQLLMNMVNVGEVYYRLAKSRSEARATAFWEDFQTTQIRIVPAPNELILQAARWKARYPISYADAFALATAIRENATLVTGDPDFLPVIKGLPDVAMEWIGRQTDQLGQE
jgi:predicted nucleic acid-binding protein